MAKIFVIAYYMHERERNAAQQMISAAETTDSFVMGEMDDADIERARREGLIVQRVEPPQRAAEPEAPKADAAAMMMASLGVDLDAAVPAPEDYYVIRLRGPITESRRRRLENAGIQLLERDAEGRGYKARLSSQQVGTARALDFVESVTWISPKRSAPAVTTRSVPSLVGETREVKMLTCAVVAVDAYAAWAGGIALYAHSRTGGRSVRAAHSYTRRARRTGARTSLLSVTRA